MNTLTTLLLVAGGGYLIYRASQSNASGSSGGFDLSIPDLSLPTTGNNPFTGLIVPPLDLTSSSWWQSYLQTVPFVGGNTDPVSGGGLKDQAASIATQFGIPPNLFASLIQKESGWDQNILGPTTRFGQAMGLTQLLPSTADQYGVTDAMNPIQNMTAGANYLSDLFHQFGSWTLALAAYNAGPTNVKKYGGIPPFAETQDYIAKILCWAKMGPCS